MFDKHAPQTPIHTADPQITEMTAEQCLNVINEADNMTSYYDSRKVAALARFAELHPATRPGADLADGAQDEVAMEMGVSPHSAATQLLEARDLVSRLPATMEALSAGRIDHRRAQILNDLTGVLSERDARRVERQVLAGGRRANRNKFRDSVRYQVIKVDPEAAELRRKAAREQRNVIVRPTNDGMARLTAHLTAGESVVAHQRITTLARQRKSPERTLAQCRADVLMDMILDRQVDKTGDVQMNVTVPLTTLMGLNRNPGEISGYGPITAEHAQELSKNARWRRVVTDPIGVVVEVNPRGYLSPFTSDYAKTRDRMCRVTGCDLSVTPSRPDPASPEVVELSLMCSHHSTSKTQSTQLATATSNVGELDTTATDDPREQPSSIPGEAA